MNSPLITLNDGNVIPQVGLGTWPLVDEELPTVLATAIEAGYRHVDTAAFYGNESGVGAGIRAAGIDRESIFLTTKLDGQFQGGDLPKQGLDRSLKLLGVDYVDMLLIHWPLPAQDLYLSTWESFIAMRESGKVRSIGVSNFRPPHIDRLRAGTGVEPAVNQIQLNPNIVHAGLRSYNEQHGIVTQSWGPLGSGSALVRDERLATIADKHGRTPGQIVLRWHVELGLVVIPKSATPSRIRENFNVFDFALDADDMGAIAELDRRVDAKYAPHLAGDRD